MKLKNEKGFVTEALTIGIIIMLIALVVLFLYTSNANNNLDENLNVASADEYIYNNVVSNNFIDSNTIALENENSVQDEKVSESYIEEYDKILNSYKNLNQVNNETTVNNNTVYDSRNNYNKYYYNQLSDNSKAIYDAIYNNKEKLKSGTYSMDIPDYVTDILYESDGKEQLSKSFQSAIDAIKMDNPGLFYIAFNKILLITETTTRGNDKTYKLYLENDENDTYLVDNFNTQEIAERAINMLENKRREILNNAIGTDYEKVKYVHDWIIENIEYETTISKDNIHNIYGALIDGEVVCGGYAKAFKYILDGLNIPCIIVQGVATNSDGISENHAWNYVKLNGSWYAIDTTWDDPIIQGGFSSALYSKHTTEYFLKGSNSISKDHVENGAFSENGKIFNYPVLSYEDY